MPPFRVPDADTAHILLVGDSTDIPAIRGMVDGLPSTAYGQIFIEVAAEVQVEKWSVPEGLTVTWLLRDASASGIRSGLAARGELVARAVIAWVAEWMPERSARDGEQYVMWIGCAASVRVSELYRSLTALLERTRLGEI